MDEPASEAILRAIRVNHWEQAKANLIALAATLPKGSIQKQEFEEVIDQLVNHIEENQLNA